MFFVSVNVLREKKSGQSLETLDEMTVDEGGDNCGKKAGEESIGELGQLVLKHGVCSHFYSFHNGYTFTKDLLLVI